MRASLGLRDIERRAWSHTFEHGLWDIAIGSLLLGFGVSILTEIYRISAIWVPPAFPGLRDLAKWLVLPHLGHADDVGEALVGVGALIAAIGIVLLLRFVRRCPRTLGPEEVRG